MYAARRLESYVAWFMVPLGKEGIVDQFNPLFLYDLGYGLGAIREAISLKAPRKDYSFLMHVASRALRRFIADAGSDLQRSAEAATNVIEKAFTSIATELSDFRSGDTDQLQQPLSDVEAAIIEANFSRFESVLGADLQRLNVYRVTQKRAYDTDTLIERGERLLSEEAVKMIEGAPALSDMRDAGRALAFGLGTATAFYLFRVVEAFVRMYFPVLNIPEPSESARNLGNYTKLIKAAGVADKITTKLDHLREEYRNPITHPEERMTIDKAEMLMGLVASVINMMVCDMIERKNANG